MMVDDRRDHSFKVPRPAISAKLGTPNACDGCHRNRSVERAAGVPGVGESPSSGFAGTFAAAAERLPDAEDGLIRLIRSDDRPAIVRATALSRLGRYASAEASRAAAEACRTVGTVEGVERLPAVVPSLGVRPVSAMITVMRSTGTRSSSAAAWASSARAPCPHSTLPVSNVIVPSLAR